jgi:hypothetical protein
MCLHYKEDILLKFLINPCKKLEPIYILYLMNHKKFTLANDQTQKNEQLVFHHKVDLKTTA